MMRKRFLFLVGLVGVIILVHGCLDIPEGDLNQQYSSSYAEGFNDGCHSGKGVAGSKESRYFKDIERFYSDPQYRRGWNDGYEQCKREREMFQKHLHGGEEKGLKGGSTEVSPSLLKGKGVEKEDSGS